MPKSRELHGERITRNILSSMTAWNVCCVPGVHFKLIIIDSTIAYVGSANLTGAGMGMKSPRKRNFEAGILTDDPEMVEAAIEQFDNVWIGKFCKDCGRREYCSDPIK